MSLITFLMLGNVRQAVANQVGEKKIHFLAFYYFLELPQIVARQLGTFILYSTLSIIIFFEILTYCTIAKLVSDSLTYRVLLSIQV